MIFDFEMHPLEVAVNDLKSVVEWGKAYSIPTAAENVREACWRVCAELHKLSEGTLFAEDTWIDSFLGFDIVYDGGVLQRIDGTVIFGDEQRDMAFRVESDWERGFRIGFSDSVERCRPYMFRFLNAAMAEQNTVSNGESQGQSALDHV